MVLIFVAIISSLGVFIDDFLAMTVIVLSVCKNRPCHGCIDISLSSTDVILANVVTYIYIRNNPSVVIILSLWARMVGKNASEKYLLLFVVVVVVIRHGVIYYCHLKSIVDLLTMLM